MCCAVLCCAVLCCAVLCCAALRWLTLDDEALAASAGAQVEVQAALKALLDKVGVGGHLQGSQGSSSGTDSRGADAGKNHEEHARP